jgi:hypothetical protein
MRFFVNGELEHAYDGNWKVRCYIGRQECRDATIQYDELVRFVELFVTPMKQLTNEDEAYDLIWNMKTTSLVVGKVVACACARACTHPRARPGFFRDAQSSEYRTYLAAASKLRGQYTFAALISQQPLQVCAFNGTSLTVHVHCSGLRACRVIARQLCCFARSTCRSSPMPR